MTHTAALVLALSLAACGGGGSGDVVPAVAVQPKCHEFFLQKPKPNLSGAPDVAPCLSVQETSP